MRVVKVPAPAIRGNTIGTIVPEAEGPLFRKISMSRSISMATRKMTIAPAAANEAMSSWNRVRIPSPA